ncbi:MAG: hypothetical protein BMS9Abin12_1985 [Acidimicrobiia bacterium]|nr:MAG: hypothetical protein BMS9Abin12_1985 [Acidimicrobiia bacterium]
MMSTPKLIGLLVAWVLASVTIAVVAAIVITELLDVIGVVESGQRSYSWAINVIALGVFIALVSVPFLLRDRLMAADD